MDSNLLSGLIGALATIIGSLLVIYADRINGKSKRKKMGFPDVTGNWRASWYIDGQSQVYLQDIVEIKKTKGLDIEGEGINTGKGNYPLHGRFAPNQIMNFTYESSENYVSLSGVVILKLNALGNKCQGRWYGYTKEDKLMGGDVTWER
jgi:hypothetical protein